MTRAVQTRPIMGTALGMGTAADMVLEMATGPALEMALAAATGPAVTAAPTTAMTMEAERSTKTLVAADIENAPMP